MCIRDRRKYKQYYLESDIGVMNIPAQQATISGCVDRELEQHLYNLISDNTPVFTPEPNDDEVSSCMDILAEWIAERHPLDARRMELFKLPQEQGEGMVAYSNRILDLADECDLNDITQQEIMAMVFITHTRSPQFRQELRRHGVGVTWQFIRKELRAGIGPNVARNRATARHMQCNGTPREPAKGTNEGRRPKTHAPGAGRASANWQRHSSRASAGAAAAPFTLSRTARYRQT